MKKSVSLYLVSLSLAEQSLVYRLCYRISSKSGKPIIGSARIRDKKTILDDFFSCWAVHLLAAYGRKPISQHQKIRIFRHRSAFPHKTPFYLKHGLKVRPWPPNSSLRLWRLSAMTDRRRPFADRRSHVANILVARCFLYSLWKSSSFFPFSSPSKTPIIHQQPL